jgi:hypothetical protein
MPPSGFFRYRQFGWIENRRPTQGNRVVPGMKIKRSGPAARPRRQIPPRLQHFATKGENRREPSGVAGRFTPQNFASGGSIIETASSLFIGADRQWRPVDSARVDSE